MAGVGGQDLGVERPLLVDLAGELDDVAGHGGARGAGPPGVGQQAVQGMTELVEAGDDLVPGQQRRSVCGLVDIDAVDDDGPSPRQVGLVDQAVHPGAALLAPPGVVVADEQAQHRGVGAGVVVHLPHANIGVVHVLGEVGPLAEGDAVQAGGGVEDAPLDDVPQLQVGGEGGVVQAEALLALGLLVTGPVCRTEGLARSRPRVGVHAGRVGLGVETGIGHGRRRQPAQHPDHRLGGAGRGLGGDDGGVVGIAEQRGALGAKAGDLDDEDAGVVLALQAAAHGPGQQLDARRVRLRGHQVGGGGEVGDARGVHGVGREGSEAGRQTRQP